MSQIAYADLHCDSVTVCCDAGGDLSNFNGQINTRKLKDAGCGLQCFAIFTNGDNGAAYFEKYAAFYAAQIAIDPYILPVYRYSDLEKARAEGKVGALLTVENLGFINGDITQIAKLKEFGVSMASLVWNDENAFAYPNLVKVGGVPDPSVSERRGLTPLGKAAVEELCAHKIIIDISHLSDGGVDDVLKISSAPVVASHSNCRAIRPVSRNLTDAQIKKIADKGGVVGLNFCRNFVGGDCAFESLHRHLKHLIKVGGEDVAAIGSDFDGILRYEELSDCLKIQPLLQSFADRGVPPRVLEKAAAGNFLRVFKQVVG